MRIARTFVAAAALAGAFAAPASAAVQSDPPIGICYYDIEWGDEVRTAWGALPPEAAATLSRVICRI